MRKCVLYSRVRLDNKAFCLFPFFARYFFFACRGMFFVEKAVVSVAFSGFFGHVNTQPSAGDKMPQAPLVRFSSELF